VRLSTHGPFGALSAVVDGPPHAAVPAPSRRFTALHIAAMNGRIGAAAELLIGGAERIPDNAG
jgi:hypothetical protein